MSERTGLPPKLIAGIDCFEDATFEACINDEHIDVLFTASTSIKNDGSAEMSRVAYQTVEYRLAKILVDLYNKQGCDGSIHWANTQSRITALESQLAQLTLERDQLREQCAYNQLTIEALAAKLEKADRMDQ